jgi:hypothetical protein
MTTILFTHRKENNMKRILMFATLVLTMLAMSATPASVQASDNFTAVLSGGDEVPPRPTQARGLATFKWSKDGTEMSYTLTAANIENVAAAHIHCGVPGANAPVGVTLYSSGGVFGADGLMVYWLRRPKPRPTRRPRPRAAG